MVDSMDGVYLHETDTDLEVHFDDVDNHIRAWMETSERVRNTQARSREDRRQNRFFRESAIKKEIGQLLYDGHWSHWRGKFGFMRNLCVRLTYEEQMRYTTWQRERPDTGRPFELPDDLFEEEDFRITGEYKVDPGVKHRATCRLPEF